VPRRSFAPIVIAVAAVSVLMTGAAALQLARERSYPRSIVNEDTLYITSGNALRRMTVGYAALAADLYWIRAIQYFGDIRLGVESRADASDYPLLYPLLDLTTTLDPRFNIAYRFGSVFLAEPFPGGVGRPDQAIALLEKGLREVPGKWEYLTDIGFVHYWWLHEYREAAQWFDRASGVPNAPWWLRSLAATTLAQGGDRASSRQMWESVRDTADNDWLRGSADRALRQLLALDQIDALQQTVDRMIRQNGPPPSGSLIQVRGGVATDPTGVPYEVDASGRVGLGRKSSLFPLPDQPVHRVTPAS
jgi:tetratricopeptide (TPR) repeat protein